MPQTGCGLPYNPILPSLSPHPTSPLRSRLTFALWCATLAPVAACLTTATHTVVISAARQVSTHVGGHVRLPRHVESAVLGRNTSPASWDSHSWLWGPFRTQE